MNNEQNYNLRSEINQILEDWQLGKTFTIRSILPFVVICGLHKLCHGLGQDSFLSMSSK